MTNTLIVRLAQSYRAMLLGAGWEAVIVPKYELLWRTAPIGEYYDNQYYVFAHKMVKRKVVELTIILESAEALSIVVSCNSESFTSNIKANSNLCDCASELASKCVEASRKRRRRSMMSKSDLLQIFSAKESSHARITIP